MNSLSVGHKKVVLFFVSLLFISWILFLAYNIFSKSNGRVLQLTDDVNVTAQIYGCILDLTAKPEKRIPSTNNWSSQLTVEIYSTSNVFIDSFVTTTNAAGQVTVNICNEGLLLSGANNYNFYIKGQSNLKKAFLNIPAFEFVTSTIDFTPGAIRLMNGETSNVYDNIINILDISTQVSKIGTVNTLNDLNRDGEVNILDVSNTVTNFGLSGDCSPQDIINGSCV